MRHLIFLILLMPAIWAQEPVRAGTETGTPLFSPPETETFHFAVFSDRTGGPASGLKILAEAVDEVNRFRPAFVMTVGDLVGGYNEQAAWLRQMQRYKEVMTGLQMPWYPVAGNHDVYGKAGDRADRGNLERYSEHFGPLYYSFDYQFAHFVILFSDEALSFASPSTNQNMSREQLVWLEQDLASSDARVVYVFLHHPRWTASYQGCNWPEVHELLVQDGRVRTVFAGHKHAYRHNGWQDGIEYLTLGMTGASGGSTRELGQLHHFNLVAVDADSSTMAVVPIGATLSADYVNDIDAARLLALGRIPGRFLDDLEADRGSIRFQSLNPLDVALQLRFRLAAETLELSLLPGESRIDSWQASGFADGNGLSIEAHYPLSRREKSQRWTTQPSTRERIRLQVVADDSARALVLDGDGACARVPSAALLMPAEGLTLEAWILPEPQEGRRALFSKAESSGWGLFWNSSRGDDMRFWLHDRESGYHWAGVPRQSLLASEGWVHVAAVWNRRSIRMFVDGRLASEVPAGAWMTPNDLPLYFGADPDPEGSPISFFKGRIDNLRLSRGARYREPFVPEHAPTQDASTLGLWSFDQAVDGWVPDLSGNGLHAELLGGARLETRR